MPTTEISEYLDRSTEYVEETDLAILRGLKVSRVGTIADRDAKVVVEVEEDSSSDLDSDIMREESEIFNDVNKLVLQFTNIETWELDSLRQSE